MSKKQRILIVTFKVKTNMSKSRVTQEFRDSYQEIHTSDGESLRTISHKVTEAATITPADYARVWERLKRETNGPSTQQAN